MAGDYSRNTFDPTKHYTRVLQQQGRVQLDADWNENADNLMHRIVEETKDVIGPVGAPKYGGGFAVGKTQNGDDLTLSPGHMYVAGILCELDGSIAKIAVADGDTSLVLPQLVIDGRKLAQNQWLAVTIAGSATQYTKISNVDPADRRVTFAPAINGGGTAEVRRATTYFSQPDLAPGALANGQHLAYLDVWERERSALDDENIREIALGGPDTARRMQTVWQVRLHSLDGSQTCAQAGEALTNAKPPTSGMLAARTAPVQGDTDPCDLPPTAGYRGMENQLYRIEIQRGGTLPAANAADRPTFKWASDDASLEVAITNITTRDVKVHEVGKDELFRFKNTQWVEIVDEASAREGRTNAMRKVANVDPAQLIVQLAADPPISSGNGLKLRRWNQQANADENGITVNDGSWITLEYGIQVRFADGIYHSGDYWLVPARTAIHDILWPRFDDNTPEYQPPRGIAHHYAPLARVDVVNGAVTNITDCRKLFPPLTHICAEDVCFDNTHCQINGAKTVQEAIDALCARRDFDFYKKHLFGYGVVCGLQLVCDGAGRPSVTVKSGYAIACDGRDMITRNDESIDLRELDGWEEVIETNAKEAAISMHLTQAGIEYRITPYEKKSWLDGTALMKAWEDCQKRVADYLEELLKDGDPNVPEFTPSERRRIAVGNLAVQLFNPQSGKAVYLSEKEHDILEGIYDDLKELLSISDTYCAMGGLKEFPPYPNFRGETVFGKGNQTRIRAARDGRTTFLFGADDRLHVFDGPVLRRMHTYPDIGGARILDVAFGRENDVVHVLAESSGKSYIASCQFAKDPGGAWSPPSPIYPADGEPERIVMLANGIDAVDIYGFGDGFRIYAIEPKSGAAKEVGGSDNFRNGGYFLVDETTHRCFAAHRNDKAAAGKYNTIVRYEIDEGGRRFRISEIYPFDAHSGDEGIAYARARGKDLVCAIVEGGDGKKSVVTFDDSPGVTRLIAMNTDSPLSITGLSGDAAFAAVGVADANRVEYLVAEKRVDELALPVQICPSALAYTTKKELLVVNHVSSTFIRDGKPATKFNTAALEKYRADVLNIFRDLAIFMAESIKDCFCEHLLIGCPVCTEKEVVYLGVVELDANKTVRRICALEKRTWVLSPRIIGYWLEMVPVLPAIRALFEKLCCFDIPEYLKDKYPMPPAGDDRFKCEKLTPLTHFSISKFAAPFATAFGTYAKKMPFAFDYFMKDETYGGETVKMESDELIGMPVEEAKVYFEKSNVPVLGVEKFGEMGGLRDLFRPVAKFGSGRAVTIVEHNGKVVNVHDRATTRDVGATREKAENALKVAGEAKATVVDPGGFRVEVDRLRTQFDEEISRTRRSTDETVTREVTRVREDLKREVADDVERLRVRIDESRRIIEERDSTINTLNEKLEKLSGELTESKRTQLEASERIAMLTEKATAVDELKIAVEKLARRPPR